MTEGAKKSGGGGGGGTEAPDSLRSVQSARLVDLISEGPVKGLVNGLKSVYLDGVPIQNDDGSPNFRGFDFGFVTGTQAQTGLPGFNAVENERSVGVEVRASAAVVQTIVSTAVDEVRVTISVPQLTTLNTSNGDVTGASFTYAIDVQASGGGYVNVHTDTVSGKTTSTYKRGVRLKLPGTGPWDIRVRRLTADSITSTLVDKFYWDSLTEIQTVTLRMPNSAAAGIRVSAEQFGRVPARAYDLLGLMVRVPTNYDPLTGVYTGIWDGTFKIAWTNNPAWVFFDLATHPRYGLGKYIKDAHLDKWRLYEIGRYCDERVPDGQGGTEPRFTCNLYLQTAVQARQALQDLAGLMRAITFWGPSQIGLVQDAPADAVMLFTKANVVGDFAYESVSRKTRHSAWTVYYNDLSQLGRRMPVVHVNRELTKTMGLVMETFAPIGCTSRGQALRLARWADYSESAGETIAFRAGAEAVALQPGSVFKVSDPHRAGARLAGRVASATTAAVALDADVVLGAGGYELEVMLVDTSVQLGYRTEKRAVTTGAGTTQVINVSPPFSVAPSKGAIWVLQPATIQPTWWRLIGRKEVEGGHAYDILGIAHDPDKFAAIESGVRLPPRPTSGLSITAPTVASVAVVEVPYLDLSTTRIKALVSWPHPGRGLWYRVSWRLAEGTWTQLPQTSANSIEIDGLVLGTLDLRIETVNSLGLVSAPKLETVELLGWLTKPTDVTGFSAVAVVGGLALSWDPCPAGNYKETVIKVGAVEETAVEIFRGAATRYTWHPPMEATYKLWARHVNTANQLSDLAALQEIEYTELIRLGLSLSASGQVFAINGADVASPAALTFTVSDYAELGDVVWSVEDGTASLTGTGDTRTLDASDLLTDSATIRVTEGTSFDEVTVVRVHDGATSINVLLSNQSHTVPADNAGAVLSYAGASTSVQVWRGSIDDTAAWTFAITPSSGVTAALTYPSGVPTITVTSLSVDAGYVDLTITRSGYPSPVAPRFSLSKVKAGVPGSPGDPGAPGSPGGFIDHVFRRSASVPATPLGDGTPAGWSDGPPSGTDPLYMSTAPKKSDDTLQSGGAWSSPVRIDGPAGSAGQSVSVQYSVDGATSWHSTFTTGDIYMRQSVDGGAAWSAAIRIVGEAGAAGINGIRTADAKVYSDPVITGSGAPSISGTSTYTWSTSSLSSAPSGWNLTPPTPPAGYSVYEGLVRLSNNSTSSTDTVNWSGAARSVHSSAALQGGTARVAYAKSTSGALASTPTAVIVAGFPGANTWGGAETWSATPPTLSAGEYQFQINGVENPATGTTTWQGPPYQSSFKVAQLSALAADLGTVTAGVINGITINGTTITGGVVQTATSGKRAVLNEGGNNNIRLYDNAGGGQELLFEVGPASYSGLAVTRSGSFTAGNSVAGLYGQSYSGSGLRGGSISGVGVYGTTQSGAAAVYGSHVGSGYGVYGYSFSGYAIYSDGLMRCAGAATFDSDVEGRGVFRLAPSGTTRGVWYYSSGVLAFEAYGAVPVHIASNGTNIAHFEAGYGTRVEGKFACNGATPQGKATFNGPCSDEATAVALLNQIRAALIANGTGQ